MGLHVGIPIFLPAVALITKLALERLHAEVLIHMLAQVSSFKETFLTLSAVITSDLGLRLVFLKVLAKSRAPVERLSTD